VGSGAGDVVAGGAGATGAPVDVTVCEAVLDVTARSGFVLDVGRAVVGDASDVVDDPRAAGTETVGNTVVGALPVFWADEHAAATMTSEIVSAAPRALIWSIYRDVPYMVNLGQGRRREYGLGVKHGRRDELFEAAVVPPRDLQLLCAPE